MKMPKAIFVSQFEPKPVGHGGNHRAYQIVHDLAQIVGRDNVVVMSWPVWRRCHFTKTTPSSTDQPSFATLRCIGRRIGPLRAAVHLWRSVKCLVGLVAGTKGTIGTYSSPEFSEYYEGIVEGIGAPTVCIIEHVSFTSLLPINAREGIPTIACIANIESFDRNAPLLHHEQRKDFLTAIDFVNEFRALAQCDERLFISMVETGLIGGLGLGSHYYPYVPVGAIRDRLERIRDARMGGTIESDLFLMLGSGGHKSTWRAFSWFVQKARDQGLPSGVRVVVAGSRTDELLPPAASVPGLTLKGWLEQEELDELLVRAQGVLAPQMIGFGALTRLPELSCAGIPVVVSQHPTYAINPPPGIEVVEDSWDAWCSKMQQIANQPVDVRQDDYYIWEEEQVNTLGVVVKQLLKG